MAPAAHSGVSFGLMYIKLHTPKNVFIISGAFYSVIVTMWVIVDALFPSEVCLFHQTLIYESGWTLFS